ncbi:MAG: twin-arginine translocation signal domain-containing protein [Actinomycetota bacterium]
MSDDQKGMERREFLRKAAITGATAAWAAPLIQTVAATPAFAQTAGTGQPGSCHHSIGGDTGEGCMGACQASGQRDLGRGCGPACNRACDTLCPVQQGAGNDRQCTSTAACNSTKWRACTFVG